MNGIVISWFFPPATSAEGLVSFKLLKNSRNRYEVVSAESRLWSYQADSALQSENIAVHPLEADRFQKWIQDSYQCCEDLLQHGTYDFFMTRSMPPQSHTVGLLLKKKHPSFFWIASMADPIGHNPYDYERYFGGGLKGFLKKPVRTAARILLYARKELFDRKIARKADLLIYPSLDQCRYTLRGRYEKYREKVLILPHSYDSELIGAPDGAERPSGGKTVISHLGHLNSQRSAKGLLEAVAKLKEQDHALSSRLCIRLVGNLPDDQKELITRLHLEDIVVSESPVNYFESIRIMKQSDFLLLIDAEFSFLENNIFFASKLADYMGAGKPIIGLTSERGPSADIVRQAGCPVCRVDDTAGIRALLKDILQSGIPGFQPESYRKYDAKNVSAEFDRALQEHLARCGRRRRI